MKIAVVSENKDGLYKIFNSILNKLDLRRVSSIQLIPLPNIKMESGIEYFSILSDGLTRGYRFSQAIVDDCVDLTFLNQVIKPSIDNLSKESIIRF